ncbi:MAG: hypothetical protein WC242_05335 [Candidatus Paceibacterota bacterium]|jgi:hypothetical protein
MKKIYLAITLLLASIFVLPQFAGAIGQVTQPIVLKDVLRGQTVQADLILLNSDTKVITYELSAEGAIAKWAKFYKKDDSINPITTIQVPATSTIGCVIKLTIPQDTPNGEYKGQAMITTIETEGETAGESNASIRLRIGRDISITITDQEILKFTALVTPMKYVIASNELLKTRIIYSNQGNILIKPTVDFKILKDNQVIFNAIYPYPEGDEGVIPFTQKIIPLIEWPTSGHENGMYQAQIKTLLNGVVQGEYKFAFEVGRDLSWYLAALASIGPGKVGLILIAIGIVLIGIFAVRTFVFKKKDWELAAGFFRNLFS